MKLLTKAELRGIDSTSSTVEKWDEFLKKAVWNLGFRQELIDGMYPYEAGIPMKDGTTLPVDEKTGRVFYKMSWADKLAGIFSAFQETTSVQAPLANIQKMLITLAASSVDFYRAISPDPTDAEYSELCSDYRVDNFCSELCNRLFTSFITDSDILQSFAHTGSGHESGGPATSTYWLTDDDKESLLESKAFRSKRRTCMGNNIYGALLYIFSNKLKDKYDAFPFTQGQIVGCAAHISSSAGNQLTNYAEVYLQDYMVVSLNPVDKLMCSTKQAFSSCMSIAKQNDTRGTSSAPALGLPSIFATDAIYMIFMTPGKHKNMYWESSEWDKIADERDKEKAYKYLKMTCRTLTYKSKGTERMRDIKGLIKDYSRSNAEEKELLDLYNKIGVDSPKLIVGRSYTMSGEDYNWQVLQAVLLSRAGVAMSTSYINEINDLRRKIDFDRWHGCDYTTKLEINTFIHKGELTDDKVVATDRYGFLRGIYYDNIQFSWNDEYNRARGNNSSGPIPVDVPWPAKGMTIFVSAGSTRNGTHGIHNWSMSSETDMFKVMTGKMKYPAMNKSAKICADCGKPLSAEEFNNKLPDGSCICNDCMEHGGYKKCEACGDLYNAETADEHEIFNFREFTNPKNYKELPPILKCRKQMTRENTVICPHCGKITNYSYYNSSASVNIEFKGMTLKAQLCDTCLGRAVMCDKCKRLHFLDSSADALILLPNRRVICPDCIDKIRAKQEYKNKLKGILKDASFHTYDEEPAEITKTDNPADFTARHLSEITGRREIGNRHTLIKDVRKQINSYLQAHPDEVFPALKSSNTPFSDEEEDIDNVLDEILM